MEAVPVIVCAAVKLFAAFSSGTLLAAMPLLLSAPPDPMLARSPE
jgi:hypothetical protein